MHILDVMHIEHNAMENILRTILGNKDIASVGEDMQELSCRPSLWLQKWDDILEGTKLNPYVPYVLDRASCTIFGARIVKLKVTLGYSIPCINMLSRGKFII